MDVFIKAVSCILISLILWLCLERNGKDISVLFSLAVCVITLFLAASMFKPIIQLVEKLRELGNINKEYIKVILKVVGIGLISEIISLICKDVGNESLGKVLQILSTILILVISVPIFDKLLDLLNNILSTV